MSTSVKEQWEQLKQENPRMRIRDAADTLKVSEAQLLATGMGQGVTLLSEIENILVDLPSLGNVMALTRSSALVHEVKAPFSQPSKNNDTILFLRPGQDTRYFIKNWAYAFSVEEKENKSLQFFDSYGNAIHKIYLRDNSNLGAYQTLVEKYKSANQTTSLDFAKKECPSCTHQKKEVDVAELKNRWMNIKNVHEVSGIIRELCPNRSEAFKSLGTEFAVQKPLTYIEDIFQKCSQENHEVIIFGMNQHAVQSYAGPIRNIKTMGEWLNILDPEFNIHLKLDLVDQVWQVQKPSAYGMVHTLHLIDKNSQEIMIMTDNQKRGETQSKKWREIIGVI